jgi:hypothetical protein
MSMYGEWWLSPEESAQYYDLIFTLNGFDHRFRYEQYRFIP